LHTSLTEELVPGSEWDLDDGTKLGQLLGSVGLDIGNTLKVSYGLSAMPYGGCLSRTDEHLYNLLPSGEPLEEDVGWL
jgi:hypothetical protein